MSIINSVLTNIINPTVKVIFALAVLYFIFGVWVFVHNAENSEKRQEGASHILYGTIGIFIMVAVGGIMYFIQHSFGL